LDDADFGAGIFEPEEQAELQPPPQPQRHRAERPAEEPQRASAAAVEEAEEPAPPAPERFMGGDDDGTFFSPAPEEVDDQQGAGVGRTETDEELIEAAREESRDAVAGESRDTRPPSRRRRRGGRRGRRGERAESEVSQGGREPPSETESADVVDFGPSADEGPEPSRTEEAVEQPPRGRKRPPGRGRAARAEDKAEPVSSESREMLINVSDIDECRIALLREGRLDELDIERTASASNVGNIYKGRVTNVESSIQAAFIDFGLPIHGFLHISDLHPKYFPESKGENELVGRKTPRRHRPPIQSCLKRGQEVIVQIIKEGIGTKGPTLSTYISLPGRFLVMMPGMEELGVSRKIEDDDQRRKMREMLAQLDLPKDIGFIVRTAGIDRTKRDLQRDLNYLTRLWSKVAARIKSEPAPAELYRESDLVIRTIRDVFDSSIKRILVDNAAVADRVREFLAIASPKSEDVVELYDGPEPMFHRFGIESEIDKLHSKHVPLPCGGSLVIEQTEALVAIDVNSGRFRVPENAEETAYRVNVEAADEIARQLRLRDLGGLIICDFIDMTQEKHRRSIERRLADALKQHKERAKLLRISRFGILEMTRQRQRPSLAKSMFAECPRCGGSGRVKATESVCLDVMRQIALASRKEGVASIDVRVSTAVANELLNRKRHALAELERAGGQTIRVHGDPGFSVDQVQLSATDRRGREVPNFSHAAALSGPGRSPAGQGAEPRRTGDVGRRTGDGGRRRGRRGSRGGRHGGRGNGGRRE
jgi:ribonuclease E